METAKNLSQFKNIRHGFCNKDDSKNVENPLLLTQIHSFEVLNPEFIEKPYNQPEGDGWVTDKKGFCLTVKSADCAPVLITDGNVIAAVHAGWKGALTGVVENAVLRMVALGCDVKNLYAAIGPCIHGQSFVVKEDMRRLFAKNVDRLFFEWEGETHFGFATYVRYRLEEGAGLSQDHVEIVDIDTCLDENYNSYRREPENPARQYSFIEKIG